MSNRPKLPPYIKTLNLIMAAIIVVICALIFALVWSSKDLGWDLPTASDNSVTAEVTSEAGSEEADTSEQAQASAEE